MDNKPLFSVVTVCYNASGLIRKTIESVLAQDFADSESRFLCQNKPSGIEASHFAGFEYIIQDGNSSDDTLTIVEEYRGRFEEKGIHLIVNSGKDKGIYDAMNKAVAAASGEYVIFMNADDCFYSANVLSEVASSVYQENSGAFSSDGSKNTCEPTNTVDDNNDVNTENTADYSYNLPGIIYGDCIVKELGMYFKFRKCYDLIKERMPFSHQACFARRELLLKHPLDLKYPITADYDFLLKCHLNGYKFYDSDVTIALVTADGVSSVKMYEAFSEACSVCESYGIPRYTPSEMKKKITEMKIKQFVLDCFPAFIKKAIRKYQVTHRGQCVEVTIPKYADM